MVTFQSNKINFHGDEPFWISAKIFNVFHKISTELVATFEDTENHNIIVSNVLHNIFCQSFCPGKTKKKKKRDKITVDADTLSYKLYGEYKAWLALLKYPDFTKSLSDLG